MRTSRSKFNSGGDLFYFYHQEHVVYICHVLHYYCVFILVLFPPLQWPQFFADILQSIQSGHLWSVDLYLRILMAIDSEVVDRHIVHTQEVCMGDHKIM